MTKKKKNSSGGFDDTTHHLIHIHQPPDTLVTLREELAYHPDVIEFAQKGETFEECLGRIALKVDIALDGEYDCEDLCGVLVTALRNRRFHPQNPHLRVPGLEDVELVEKEDSVELVRRDRNVATKVPEGSVVTETTNNNSNERTRSDK
jgi:hypothetical protein